jgi:hypothetical protein
VVSLPLQAIDDYALTLVRPIPCIINQPCPNGIVANVEPFFAIVFLVPGRVGILPAERRILRRALSPESKDRSGETPEPAGKMPTLPEAPVPAAEMPRSLQATRPPNGTDSPW